MKKDSPQRHFVHQKQAVPWVLPSVKLSHKIDLVAVVVVAAVAQLEDRKKK